MNMLKAKQLYDINRSYVETNGDKLSWRELSEYCRTQDCLYRLMAKEQDRRKQERATQ